MSHLKLYQNIYADSRKLQAEWLKELNGFHYSNRVDFSPTLEQSSKFKNELNDLLEKHTQGLQILSEDYKLGLRIHFEARLIPTVLCVAKALHMYFSPEITTLFTFMKVLDHTLYDVIKKGEINYDNLSKETLLTYIKAVNSVNAKPFSDELLNELLIHYEGVFEVPLGQAQLTIEERFKGLQGQSLTFANDIASCLVSVKHPVYDKEAEDVMEVVRQSGFTFSRNSWEKLSKNEEISAIIERFIPDEYSPFLTIELQPYKAPLKSNINFVLGKMGLFSTIFKASIKDASRQVLAPKSKYNEALHIRLVYRVAELLERMQFYLFDNTQTKDSNLPLGACGFLLEIYLSHCVRSYDPSESILELNEAPFTTTFNPQLFTTTLFNNSCLSSPFVESVESMQTSMIHYANMYRYFFNSNDLKEMVWIYVQIARIPDLILNRQNYVEKKS